MSPVSSAGGGVNVSLNVGNGEKAARGRFATDFEVKEVIGAGGFGTVYKVSQPAASSQPPLVFLRAFFL